MSKLISQDEQGIIWVESSKGDVLGVVSSSKILDGDGIPYQNDSLSVLEEYGFEIEQHWDAEMSYIEFPHENGEVSELVFINSNAFLNPTLGRKAS